MNHEEKYKEQKQKDIAEYLTKTSNTILYNGSYAIYDGSNGQLILAKENNEEIYSYIQGYLDAAVIYNKKLQEQIQINNTNIKNYEAIIGESGGETISEES